MTTDEMIEVMAREIYKADDPWHIAWPWPDLQSDQAGVDQYRRIACAALAAILPVLREEVAERMDNARASYRAASIPSVGKGRQEARDYKTMAIAFAHAGVEIRARFDQIAKEVAG